MPAESVNLNKETKNKLFLNIKFPISKQKKNFNKGALNLSQSYLKIFIKTLRAAESVVKIQYNLFRL